LAVVLHIFTAPERGAPMQPQSSVAAVADCGLVGDRYSNARNRKDSSHQLTLIESEHIQAFAAAIGIDFKPHEPRRNLVTAGVRLNDLVGAQFLVGGVVLEGLELCEPCIKFKARTRPEVLRFFAKKGGLRARILEGGVITLGDSVAASCVERSAAAQHAK
jgi:MOSC domain-containing protein YiiM